MDISGEKGERTKVLISMPVEVVEWLDSQAKLFDRDRSWMVFHAVDMWRKRLDRERKAAEARKARRAGR